MNAEGYSSCMYTLYIWQTHERDCMKEEQQEIHMTFPCPPLFLCLWLPFIIHYYPFHHSLLPFIIHYYPSSFTTTLQHSLLPFITHYCLHHSLLPFTTACSVISYCVWILIFTNNWTTFRKLKECILKKHIVLHED